MHRNRDARQGRWLRHLGACALVAALAVGAGCGRGATAPRLVVEWRGQLLETSFDRDAFVAALEREHGGVSVGPDGRLATRALVVLIEPLPDGRALVKSITQVADGRPWAPAVFFGLAQADPEAVTPVPDYRALPADATSAPPIVFEAP